MIDKFIGLDISLSNSGIVVLSINSDIPLAAHSVKSKKQDNEIDRLVEIGSSIIGYIIPMTKKEVVVFEAPSFGSKGRQHSRSELTGQLKYRLVDIGVPTTSILTIAPTTLKKFATGSGKSPKGAIIKSVYKKWEFDINDDNIADAYVLAALARAAYLWATKSHENEIKYEKESIESVIRQNPLWLKNI